MLKQTLLFCRIRDDFNAAGMAWLLIVISIFAGFLCMNLCCSYVETDYLNTCARVDYATLAYLPGTENAEAVYAFLQESDWQLTTFIAFCRRTDGSFVIGWDGTYGISQWTSLTAGRSFSADELEEGLPRVILDEGQFNSLQEATTWSVEGESCTVIGSAWINSYTFLSKLRKSSQKLITMPEDPGAVFSMKTEIIPYLLYRKLGLETGLILISFANVNAGQLKEIQNLLAEFDNTAEVTNSSGNTEKFRVKDFLSRMPFGLLVCLNVWLGLVYLFSFWETKVRPVRRIYILCGMREDAALLAESAELLLLLLAAEAAALLLQYALRRPLEFFGLSVMPAAGFIAASVGTAYLLLLVLFLFRFRRPIGWRCAE